jgi:UDP-N-acetylmuramoylalanine--D-glutamate ligase
MEKALVFEFVSYNFEPQEKRILFRYRQTFKDKEALEFTETVLLPEAIDLNDIDKGLIEKLLADLHLVLGVSYYKFYCATKVKHPYSLSKSEAQFWNTMYREGLGEFYYRNQLDPNNAPTFSFDKKKKDMVWRLESANKFLMGLSGGKDSIVAAQLLKEQGSDMSAFFVETNRDIPFVDQLAKTMQLPMLKIRRVLDEKVFQPYPYNGHIPISAVYGFLGAFASVVYGYSDIVISNGYSTNIGNVEWKGFEINHQWSKSAEFEALFSKHLKEHISPDLRYFSLLRPFYEIRIAELFSQYPQYFPLFSSCNKNFTLVPQENRGLWCGKCAKCVFVFNLLSPFIPKDQLINIFKKNLYEDESLLPLFKDILGLGTMKPFDCVGTFEESSAAFVLGSKQFASDFIVRQLAEHVKISEQEIKQLFKPQSNSMVPDRLEFLGMKNALILGYGKEGMATEVYLQKQFPTLKTAVADESRTKDYLDMQKDFDIAVKTPGIHKSKVTIPYTTATNIFFSEVKARGNLIIGVTGSKGKSTTASLIAAIIKTAGRDVQLVGNIGNPMLEVLLKPIKQDEIFVVELSSYQLDDIRYSPDIAVVTNLFPEHMDFHGGLEQYYEAKKNIIRFQNPGDLFFYNGTNKLLKDWAKETKAMAIAAKAQQLPSNLLGKHNEENISLAIAVADSLGISKDHIARAVQDFQPLSHRLELVGTFQGITFYDDAISTTPESTILAIEALKNVDTIFLGGQDRGFDFSPLEKAIKKYKIKNIVLFPDSGSKIHLNDLNVLNTASMEEAVKFAYENTAAGKTCLLSCASPSYSLWKNFEEKGDEFKKFVMEYSREPR